MNKNLIIIIGLLLVNFTYSQKEKKIGINLGSSSTNFILDGKSWFDRQGKNGINTTIGYLIGVNFEYKLRKKLSLKANLNYASKKDKNYFQFTDNTGKPAGEYEDTVSHNFLEMPILLIYYLDNSNFFTTGGPVLNYRLKIKSVGTMFYNNSLNPLENSYYDKQLDLGISLGVGYNFHLNGKNDLALEIRYNSDIANLIKEENVPNAIKTNTLQFIMNWNFKI